MNTSVDRARWALTGLRVAVAGLMAAHGWGRFAADAVTPFGGFLAEQGIPFGTAIAVTITTVEIVGTPFLAWGRMVLPLCLWYAAVLIGGIVLVHGPEGWFVVGLGRNGMEYSALLIGCLLAVGMQDRSSLAWLRSARDRAMASRDGSAE